MLERFVVFEKAREFYRRCKVLKIPEPLRDQLVRASSSVALNIAEGSGKRTTKDKQRYFTNALGSLRECEGILRLEDVEDPRLLRLLDELGAMLYTLSRNLPRNAAAAGSDAESAAASDSESDAESDAESDSDASPDL